MPLRQNVAHYLFMYRNVTKLTPESSNLDLCARGGCDTLLSKKYSLYISNVKGITLCIDELFNRLSFDAQL